MQFERASGRRFTGISPLTSARWHRQFAFSALLLLSVVLSFKSALAQTTFPPILISQQTSTRALALESVQFTTEPFSLNSPLPWNPGDGRTRIILFALNLRLEDGDPPSSVICVGEDGNHSNYSLAVEHVAPVPQQEWMTAIVVRLNNGLGSAGDLLVRISYRGRNSNRVRVGIGFVGGGLPDDLGAVPTPAPPYRIDGRVTNGTQGVAGVRLTLTGTTFDGTAVNISTASFTDGSYLILAPAMGNYTLTTSIPQNWYTITPGAISLDNLISPRTTNFSATYNPPQDPPYVLEFDGSPKSVDYGFFWSEGVNLGHFFWEVWAAPGPYAGATYMLTDGYGGAHALLFGFGNFGSSEANRYELLGNIYNGVRADNYFGSDEGPAAGEWGHFAVGWDGQNVVTYFNGVPVGKAPFTGPRRSPGVGGGGGRLMVGGSDHSNFEGRIAQVRGYEGSNPRESVPGGVEASFAPETVFSPGANLMSYYFRQGTTVADLSNGYGNNHIGLVRGTAAGVIFDCGACPTPQFVIDPSAPHFLTGTPSAPVQVPNPATVPSGALVFDSFSRPNSTYLFGAPGGLGSTEGGSEGPQFWLESPNTSSSKSFGILNAHGVLLANSRQVAWVNTHSATGNVQVTVERRAGPFYGCGLDTGLSFRVVDTQNYFFAYTSANGGVSDPRVLTVGYYVNNQRVDLVMGLSMPATWTALKVSSSGNDIQVFADDELIYSTSRSLFAGIGGVGLYNNSAGLGLVNRWDNFTVFAIP